MVVATTRIFLILAIVTSALLSGADVDRELIATPAWHQVGVAAWGDFSQRVALGNGRMLYPLEAVGSLLLALTAAFRLHFERSAPRVVHVLLDAAALLVLGVQVFTGKAASILIGVISMRDPAALQRAFEAFRYWGNLRGVCQLLALAAQAAALAVLCRNEKPTHPFFMRGQGLGNAR